MLCRRELITIVTPLSRPGSAKTASSVCLYSVYRKQETLFTAALEQTSNVPTAIIGRVRRWACGLPHPASGWRSRPSVTLHVCILTGAPRRRRRGRCPLFHVPTPATSTDCPAVSDGRGEAVIPRPVVRGPMAVALPRSRSPVPSP